MLYKQKNLKDIGIISKNKTYIIAEIGLNHGGNIEVAKKLIDSAAKTGVNAVKFQTYITEKRVSKDSPIFDILKKCELPFSDFEELKKYAEDNDVEFFSTPFDDESVDFLDSIGCQIFKLASFDVVNKKMLQKVAKTNKTIILSVGMSNIEEIKEAYQIIEKETIKIALLHCISAYPTKEEDAKLAAIYTLKSNFDCIIGQSDHTPNIRVPLYAVAAGAQIIEKHYKIDERMECVDAPVSITESQMKELVNEIKTLEEIMGNGQLELTEAQSGATQYRRYR